MTSPRKAPARVLSLVLLVATLALGLPVTANAAPDLPTLSMVKPGPYPLGMIQVRGTGFTPGSAVTLVVLDGDSFQAAARRAEVATTAWDGSIVVWLRGSDFILSAPNGSQDPAWMNSSGSTITPVCDKNDYVRAYEDARDLWTEPIHLACWT